MCCGVAQESYHKLVDAEVRDDVFAWWREHVRFTDKEIKPNTVYALVNGICSSLPEPECAEVVKVLCRLIAPTDVNGVFPWLLRSTKDISKLGGLRTAMANSKVFQLSITASSPAKIHAKGGKAGAKKKSKMAAIGEIGDTCDFVHDLINSIAVACGAVHNHERTLEKLAVETALALGIIFALDGVLNTCLLDPVLTKKKMDKGSEASPSKCDDSAATTFTRWSRLRPLLNMFVLWRHDLTPEAIEEDPDVPEANEEETAPEKDATDEQLDDTLPDAASDVKSVVGKAVQDIIRLVKDKAGICERIIQMVVDNPTAIDEDTLETHANLAAVHRLVRPACEKDSALMKDVLAAEGAEQRVQLILSELVRIVDTVMHSEYVLFASHVKDVAALVLFDSGGASTACPGEVLAAVLPRKLAQNIVRDWPDGSSLQAILFFRVAYMEKGDKEGARDAGNE